MEKILVLTDFFLQGFQTTSVDLSLYLNQLKVTIEIELS